MYASKDQLALGLAFEDPDAEHGPSPERNCQGMPSLLAVSQPPVINREFRSFVRYTVFVEVSFYSVS